jgi:YD repeat-containing protein
MGYDALDRLTAIDRPNTSYWESDDTFGYDNLGRRTLASTSFGNQITFSHDALGRLTGEASNWHGSSSAEYDAAGRRTRRVYAAGQGDERYDYLATGEMTTIRAVDNTLLATFGYDDLGRRTSLSRVNGTGTSYGYDAAGRLGTLAHNFAGTAHDVTFGYAYNPAGQITSRSANNGAYSHTGVANQNVTDSHNGLNQVTASGSTQVTHDARGNTTQIGSSSYAYTADNRLLAAAGDVYIHDAVGRLIYDHYVDNLYDPGTGQRTGEKVSGGGPVTHVYVLGPGVNEPLMDYTPGSGTLTQLHADERGSIIAQSDGGGNVTAIDGRAAMRGGGGDRRAAARVVSVAFSLAGAD